MKARWDPNNERWEASLGSGSKRKWFRSRTAGDEGRLIVEAKVRQFVDGPPRLRPGSLAEFIETVWWPILCQDSTFRTRQTYKSILDNHLQELQPRLMDDLRIEVLQPWATGLASRKVGEETVKRSPKTVKSIVAVLTAILDLAHRSGKLAHKDYCLIRTPRVPKKQAVSLDLAQLAELEASVMGTSLEGPVWAASRLGLRRNEVCGLKVGHIEIRSDRAVVRVQDNRQTHGEEARLKSKGPGEVRTLVLPKEWGTKLMSFAPRGSIYVFCGEGEKPVHPNFVTKKIPHYCRLAKVPVVTFHSLRHSCASNMRQAGIPESKVQAILGHSNIDTTLLYLDDRADEQLEAFKTMQLQKTKL